MTLPGDISFRRPFWLAALPLVLLAALWVRRRRLAGEWAGVIDAQLLPALRQLGLLTDSRRDPAVLAPFIAGAFLCLGLAGPAVLRPGAIEYRALDPLILAIDMSPSVVADERVLTDAKTAAAAILPLAKGRPVGIMLYAADAYLASAPTTDAESLSGMIAVLSRDTMPVVGSRPDIALTMTRRLFGGKDKAGQEGPGLGGADIVMITDGAGTGPQAIEEAARLASDGARIWTLALPRTAEGAPPPDPEALASLARAGKGDALAIDETTRLMAQIDARRTARLARQDGAGQSFRDLGPFLLPFALLAIFPLFRRRK